MSPHTAELMQLLHTDGVDGEELMALVDSAFRDGLNFMIKYYDNRR